MDVNHRCGPGCKYTQSRTRHVAICQASLHTHTCTPDTCTLSQRMSDTTYACSITGLQTKSPEEQQHVQLHAVGSYNRSSRVHWSKPARRARTSSQVTALRVIQRILDRVFLSKERQALTHDALKKRHEACNRHVAAGGMSLHTFVRVRAIVRDWHESTRPMPSRVPRALATYIHDLIVFVNARSTVVHLPLKHNVSCLTYGLLQLLTSGFAPMGVCAIRRIPFMVKHGITPSQYARLPGLRARQQSISVRQLQRICVDDSGRATAQFPTMGKTTGDEALGD